MPVPVPVPVEEEEEEAELTACCEEPDHLEYISCGRLWRMLEGW